MSKKEEKRELVPIKSNKLPVPVKKGDLIGYIGNTGTKYGAQGNNAGAHLHWEMHFENKDNIYYLGQNIEKKRFIELTKKIFEKEI